MKKRHYCWRKRTFQFLIDGNQPFPCPELAGCCTLTAEVLLGHRQVAVREKRVGKEEDSNLKNYLSRTCIVHPSEICSMEKTLEEIFSLAEETLKNNPRKTKEILDLIFYSMKNGTFYEILNVENRIHEIANSNPYFSPEYIRRYVELFSDWSYLPEPPKVHYFLPKNIGPLIPVVGDIDHSRAPDRIIKAHFFRALIQKCNAGCKNLTELQQIAERLAGIADTTPFVNNPYKRSDFKNFDSLVDKSFKLIEEIEECAFFRVRFYQICRNLGKYPCLKKYIEVHLAECIRDQRFSSLLWLLMETNDLHDAYLSELERGLLLYESLPNEQYTTPKRIKKEIKNQLENNEDFNDFLSEILIMNRMGDKRILVKDKKIGKKYIDLEIQVGKKKVLLEIRAPKIQRDVRIAGAGFLQNQFDRAIADKRRQLRDGLSTDTNQSIKGDELYYYVVIDGSKTPFANDCQDLFIFENEEHDLISGVIVFRPNARIITPHQLSLSGWIENNPKGRNVLTKGEFDQVFQILFG
jgi:hypothetical protein